MTNYTLDSPRQEVWPRSRLVGLRCIDLPNAPPAIPLPWRRRRRNLRRNSRRRAPPIHMPKDSVSILQKLLTREPELRLGSGPTDAQEIMSHAFFSNINWDDVYHKRIPAPFIPQISSATDTSNFDTEFTSVTPVLTPVQSGEFYSSRSVSFSIWALANCSNSFVAGYARGIQGILVLS